MTPTQFKIFAWFYTLADTMIAGAATAFVIEVNKVAQGGVFSLRSAWNNALIAGVVAGVLYLKQSPLPLLIANRQGNPPTPQATLEDGLHKLSPPPFFERPESAPPPPPAPVRQVVITEINREKDADETQR